MSFKKYKLKDLVDNFSVRARDYGGSDGLEFLGVSNDDGIVKSKSAAEHKGEEYKIIEKGCFAYNPYRVNIGSIAYHNEDIKGLISPAYVIFKTKSNSIKDNLLFKFLKSAEGLRQIRFHGRGTVRQALRFEDLCKIEISIPSFEEQENLISNIEKTEFETKQIFEELTNQLDIIKQLRQAFLREAMQGKLVGSGKRSLGSETGQQLLEKIKDEKTKLIAEKKLKKEKVVPPITDEEIPFEIPEHWAWCRLGEVVEFLNGYAFKSEWFKNDGIPLLRNINIGINELVWNNVERISEVKAQEFEQYYLKEGDIILSLDRPIINAGLKIAQIKKSDLPCLLLQRVLKVKSISLNENFVYKWFNSELFINYINPGRSIGIPHISHNDVSKILFPLPPLHEQEQIVAKLEELMTFCDGLEQSIKESQGYNEMLLQQVLREALQGEEKINTI
ncbi:restriction endonuclease subunit S [Flavobacterium psychrophilum]|nr:restriction endonuclease subunit S [Flavobacterium psychrophilum]